jgi:hypothetical protein
VIKFEDWSAAAFGAAKEKGLPVLLLLAPRRAAPALEEIFKGQDPGGKAVTIAVNEADRPDVWARYSAHGSLLLLDAEAEVLDAAPMKAAADKLPGWLNGPPGAKAKPAELEKPVWTGAVGGPGKTALDKQIPRLACEAVHSQKKISADGLALLLYAATEWGDAAAKQRAEQELDRAAAELRKGVEDVGDYARTLRNVWDGFAAFGREAWRQDASDGTALLVKERFDAARACFRSAAPAGSTAFADQNALAVLALQKASVFEPGSRYGQVAEQALGFLKSSLYDPVLGLLHRRREDSVVYGLLGDSAWAALAFTEAFLLGGQKPHREFADELARFLFQELWDRDGGGFLDRVSRREDLGLLKSPRPAAPAEHAAALESLWRLHHLKGNMNYRRWLEWALARASRPEADCAGAARVQDMLGRGRLDLHLIGRPGDPACDALLAAAQRPHAPRRIVSFVDPDDQDYILAHKLEAPSYPRLFGCVDLRAVADTDSASGVPAVFGALSSK